MKQLLLCLFLISTLNVFAQKGFFTAALDGHFADNLGAGFGADLSGNGKVFKDTYLGVGIGVKKYANIDKPYLPFTGRISFIPSKIFQNNIAVIDLMGGYGLYNQTNTGTTHVSNGGPTFGCSIGIATATKGRARFYGSLGYTAVGLENNEFFTDAFGNYIAQKKFKYYGGINVKMGIMLF
jgi:hypothetical protein